MTERKTIPVAHPVIGDAEKKNVLECMETGWISSIGRFIPLFEEGFARYCGASHAVACNNGTTALHLALSALGSGPGDEVIVPTLTYVATANAVHYCGARPVLVDSEPRTMAIDPQRIEERITARTKGIVVVHLYGHPAAMDDISAIARKHGLFVLEDAAEAHGALYRGRRTGSLGDAATFSFYGNKIVTTGEGGMVTTSNRNLADKLRILRGQGMDPGRRYWFPVVGYNYRMTNICAAIGVAQLQQIDLFLEQRCRIAHWYGSLLAALEDFLVLPCEEAWARHAFWSYVIVLRDSVRLDRDEFMQRLADDGIETRPVFYPMHVMPPYREPDARYPVADRLSSRGLSIPMHGLLGEDDVTYIAGRIAHWSKHPGP
ncbi:MAG TPA: DegT/DnrJ/EryC1/StrS family aminotransferase [Bryobacteraceae bacterium]|nr:DegT/DnrJ/EryC1/StrS family aminotransferase [Bryobacteraceae bacterium]